MMLRTMRLSSSDLSVDVRLAHIDGRWIASADTPDGPSMGLGWLPLEALAEALTPFNGAVEGLLQSVPDVLYWR